MGGAIYARQPKAQLNRVFTFFCAIMAVMSLAQVMLAIARDSSEAAAWMKIGMAFWPYSMTILFVFSLVYTKTRAREREERKSFWGVGTSRS